MVSTTVNVAWLTGAASSGTKHNRHSPVIGHTWHTCLSERQSLGHDLSDCSAVLESKKKVGGKESHRSKLVNEKAVIAAMV